MDHGPRDPYHGIPVAPITVTVTDDDLPALAVSPSAVRVAEAGGTAAWTVALAKKPTGDVTVTLASSAPGNASVSPASLSFTTADWDTAQTVTATGRPDAVFGDRGATVTHAARGGGYDPAPRVAVAVTVENDDTAAGGLTFDPARLTVARNGTATYTVVLDAQPAGDVVVSAWCTAPEGPFSGLALQDGSTLTFTPSNWSTPQTATVTAPDHSSDVAHAGFVHHALAGSGYSGGYTQDLPLTVLGHEAPPGLTIVPEATTVSEPRGTLRYTFVLDTYPLSRLVADTRTLVTVTPKSSNEGAATVSGPLTFAANTFDVPRTVTVTARNNFTVGDRPVTITHRVTGGLYDGVTAPLSITVLDEDGRVNVSPSSLAVSEAGGAAVYTLSLAFSGSPTGEVRVSVASSDLSAATASPASLTFTTSNYHHPQTVTVTGVPDGVVDDRSATLTHVASGGGYDGVPVSPVAVTVPDADPGRAGVTFTPGALTVAENGAPATWRVRLNAPPADELVLALAPDPPDAPLGLDPTRLAFTPADWNADRTVTVTAVDDDRLPDLRAAVPSSRRAAGPAAPGPASGACR